MADAPEFGLVRRVRLDPQAGREHELPDRRAEAGQEGVEGLRGGKAGCQRGFVFASRGGKRSIDR